MTKYIFMVVFLPFGVTSNSYADENALINFVSATDGLIPKNT